MAKRILYLALVILVLAAPRAALGQTTEFTFQGRLLDNTLPPTASYDFEFRLYDAEAGGTEIGMVSRPAVQVNSGVFSVPLDFGAQFDGSPRFLEIAVKPAGSPDPMLVLAPRQPISSTPYSIRSLSATAADVASDASQLGGVAAADYVVTTDPRMTNERAPTAGSQNYIQNRISQQAAAANFNISGSGTATLFNAGTQYNISNNRILSSPGTLNTFVGINNGPSITSGERNTFVGRNTGVNTTTGSTNTFVGSGAGFENISGSNNSFYGYNSGLRVTSGSRNSFFGVSAGSADLTGNDNSFLGYESGLNTTGSSNSFFGKDAGRLNGTGANNTAIGVGASVGTNLTFATAIGSLSAVTTSSTVKLGRTADKVIAPGRLIVGNETTARGDVSLYSNNILADNIYMQPFGPTTGIVLGTFALFGATSTDFSISHYDGTTRTERFRINSNGGVSIFNVPSGSGDHLCLTFLGNIVTCGSLVGAKVNISDFRYAPSILDRLRPVSFNWKEGGKPDLGLIAEEVAEIEPLLVTYNDKGEVEGVKYDRIGVVLINVVKEQQEQLDAQRKEIDALKAIVCELKPAVEACR